MTKGTSLAIFLILSASSAIAVASVPPAYVIPADDMYISSDAILLPGYFNISDQGERGVIIINASNIVLDCNGAIIHGNMTGSDNGILCRGFNNVTIKNCTAMNYNAGIAVEMSQNTIITNSNATFNRYGIYLFQSNGCIVSNNSANSNKYKGIGLHASRETLVTSNDAKANEDGIFMGPVSSKNRIIGNNASSNKQAGIYIYAFSNSSEFGNNILNYNRYGFYLETCICPSCGYCPGGSLDNIINKNIIFNNRVGVFSNQSSSVVESNIICNNTESDFKSSGWLSSSWENNTCNEADGWNDEGRSGCAHACSVP